MIDWLFADWRWVVDLVLVVAVFMCARPNDPN